MSTDLEKLVQEPAEQALRALRFINDNANPEFELGDGSRVRIDKCLVERYFVVTLTLESLNVFTADLLNTQRIGILADRELPWAVWLCDLRLISEIISLPVQFPHYLGWRLHVHKAGRVSAGHDEMNWLSVYFVEGPQRLEIPTGFEHLDFTSYTTAFDDYVLRKTGIRTKPAARPEQPMPIRMHQLLLELGESSQPGFTDAANAILDFSLDARKPLGVTLERVLAGLQWGTATDADVEVLVHHCWTSQQCQTEAAALMDKSEKRVVSLGVASQGSELLLTGWGFGRKA